MAEVGWSGGGKMEATVFEQQLKKAKKRFRTHSKQLMRYFFKRVNKYGDVLF